MNPVLVTAAIIENESKILIAQRKADKNEALKWEFPGGKLEEGESPEQSLVREIKEELNLDIKVNDIFEVVHHVYPNITILLLAYKCNLLGEEIEALDCNDFKWISKEEFENYTFAEADIPIVEKIQNQGY